MRNRSLSHILFSKRSYDVGVTILVLQMRKRDNVAQGHLTLNLNLMLYLSRYDSRGFNCCVSHGTLKLSQKRTGWQGGEPLNL